jgi:transcriptional regulator
MYQPKHFEETRPEALEALMAEYPLATLVTLGASGLEANHVPLAARRTEAGALVLEGHVARANGLWQQAGQDFLVIFQGAQHYVSPAWYASKKEHGKVVPTWNYAVVHAQGKLIAHDDPVWLQSFLGKLTQTHEAKVASDWKVTDAPDDFIEQLKKSIVGIEIPVTRISGKWKVSQNRPMADRVGVKAALQRLDPQSAKLVQG